MSAHTPGPWVAVHQSITDAVEMFEIAEISHMRIVQDRGVAWPAHQGKPEDDARLISAAPELLEALQLYIAHATEPECVIWRDVQSRARSAIAKATGGQQ